MKEELWIIEKNGKRRRAVKKKCTFCNKDILVTLLAEKRNKEYFCNSECYNANRSKNTTNINCIICGKSIKRNLNSLKFKKSKSKLCFCSRKCKEYAQSYKSGCILLKKAGKRINHYNNRELIRTTNKLKCCDCGENKNYLLVIHHIDGNKKNDDNSNLEIVCANCHIKRHLINKNGKWLYSTFCLTDRSLLKSL